MEVRDKIELLPYKDLDELVQLCIRVEQQLKRKPSSKNSTSYSYTKKDQAPSVLGIPPSKPKDDKGKNIEEITPRLVHKIELVTSSASNVLGKATLLLNALQRKP